MTGWLLPAYFTLFISNSIIKIVATHPASFCYRQEASVRFPVFVVKYIWEGRVTSANGGTSDV